MNINIDEYYKKYGPLVFRRCIFLLKDEELAMDAMQETFLNLLKAKSRLKGDYPSALLYKMATNVSLNILKSKMSKEVNTEDTILQQIASHEDHAGNFVIRDFLLRLFDTEKASTREIAIMHYIDGLTLAETARETGLSVSGVRKRLRNLRMKARLMEEQNHA